MKMTDEQLYDFMEHHTGTLDELIITARVLEGVNPQDAERTMDYCNRLWKAAGIEG